MDNGRLRGLLDRIAVETTELRRIAAYADADLEADRDRLAAAKYRLVVAIEAAIDAGELVIAERGLRQPANFADTFAILGEAGLISGAPSESLQRMARFRNLLVHLYERVDDARVVGFIRTRLPDMDEFRTALAGNAEP